MPSLISKNHLKFKTPQEFIEALEAVQQDNSYLSLDKEYLLKKLSEEVPEGELGGYFFACKDLISNTDHEVTGGSKFLEGYTPPFNSSTYKALIDAGAVNITQANLDEFGLGGTGLCSHYGVVPNPVDKERIIGGSSSGSVYLIQKGLVDFSLASDTGDSARYPASLAGIIGFKPSYGFISRYGFFPFCSSFDTPSICASSFETLIKVFSVVSFPDPKDLCTLKTTKKDYLPEMDLPIKKKLRIAYFEDTFWSKKPLSTNEVKTKFDELIKRIPNILDAEVEVINFKNKDLLRLCGLLYGIIAFAESVSNYSNLTGLLFPIKGTKILNKDKGDNYEEILFKNRSVFGSEFTFRQILGKYFVDGENYESLYIQSKKIISLINKEMKDLLNTYDLIISPTTIDIPEKIEDWKRGYSPRNDVNIRLLANFCALPAISIPWETVSGLPIGLHIMSKYATDSFLLNVSQKLMKSFNR